MLVFLHKTNIGPFLPVCQFRLNSKYYMYERGVWLLQTVRQQHGAGAGVGVARARRAARRRLPPAARTGRLQYVYRSVLYTTLHQHRYIITIHTCDILTY